MSQGAKNKRNGSAFETALVNYFRLKGFEADRLRLSGSGDEGDLVIRDSAGPLLVVEAKAGKNVRPRYWYDEEAVPEAANYEKHRGMRKGSMVPVLAMKAHNKSIGKSLITISLDDLNRLIGGPQ